MDGGRDRVVAGHGSRRARAALIGSTCAALMCAFALTPAAAASTWTIVPSPNVSTTHANQLESVSCVSASFCVAVGYHETNTVVLLPEDEFVTLTLIEQWNGTAWSRVPSPNPVTNGYAALHGVSCTSTTFCMAIGEQGKPGGVTSSVFAERWNGTAWTVIPAPESPKNPHTQLTGISCVGTSFCMAVGRTLALGGAIGTQFTVAERWNGTSWSLVSTPDPTTQATLHKVSCTSSDFCMAVGAREATFGATAQTLSERWLSGSWTVRGSPDPTTTHADFLEDVSCTGSTTFCMASGTYSNGSQTLPLTARWDGSAWSVVTAAAATGATETDPSGISCAGQAFCAAVGFSDATRATLAEQWQGSSFAIAPSQNTGGGHPNTLDSVSCPTVSFCAAVGTSGPMPPAGGPTNTLAELGPASTLTTSTGPSVPNTGAAIALGVLLLLSGLVIASAAVVGLRRSSQRTR